MRDYIQPAIDAAQSSWSKESGFVEVDSSPYENAKDNGNAGPHAEVGFVREKDGSQNKTNLRLQDVKARVPTGQQADERLSEVAGRLPRIMKDKMGLSDEEAQEKAKQFVLMHELGHCKDYKSVQAGMDEAAKGGPEAYQSWKDKNPDLAKAIPEPIDTALHDNAGAQRLKDAVTNERTVGQLEASADVFAIEAGAKAGLWPRDQMYEAAKSWRAPVSTDDMDHYTNVSLDLAQKNPQLDHNDVARLEIEKLKDLPPKPDGIEWDQNGNPKGMTKEELFAYKRRESLTGLEIGEENPSPSPESTPQPSASGPASDPTPSPSIQPLPLDKIDIKGKLDARREALNPIAENDHTEHAAPKAP